MSNENIGIESNEKTGDEISLIDLIAVIAKRWKFIFISTFLAAVFIFTYSIYTKKAAPDSLFNMLPDVFCPKVVVRLQEASGGSSLSSLINSSGNSLLSGILSGASSGSSNAELAQALIKGNTLVDQLAEEMDFIDRYGIDEYPVTSTRMKFQENTILEYEASTGLLTIGYEDTDPVFATNVVNRALELLEKRFRELTMDTVSSKLVLYKELMEKQESSLAAAQNKLIDFMQENGIVNMEVQVATQVKEISILNSQLINKQVELKILKERLSKNDPEVIRLENTISEMKELIRGRTYGFSYFSSPAETIPQYELPKLAAEYKRIEKELNMNTELYISFRTQFESTKMEESNNLKQFQIIERAEVPEMKSKPSRAKICLIFTIAIAFLSIFAVFIMEYIERVKSDPIESEKLKDIKKSLRFRK